MRIAVVSATVFPCPPNGYSGLEMIAWQQARGLAARGHQVTLIAPNGSHLPGGQVIPFGEPGKVDEKTAYGHYWQYLPGFDAIIDNSWQKWPYILKQEGKLKAPVLGVLHAPVDTMFREAPTAEKPCFVCISEDQAAHFKALFGKDARVAPHGIDVAYYRPFKANRSDRFLFLARFSAIKGPDLAIEACLKAGAGLDLVGDTSITNEPDFLNKCKSRCDGKGRAFVGGQSRGGCVWWMNKALCLLHPNKRFREPFGLAPLESQACFPADVTVRANRVQRLYSHTHTGTIIELHTHRGKVECTPEHPFMTQRGWVEAGHLTTDDSLVWSGNDGWNGVAPERIGSLVKRLSQVRDHGSGEVPEQVVLVGEDEGTKTWAVARQSQVLHRGGDGLHPTVLPEQRAGVCRKETRKKSPACGQKGTVHGGVLQSSPGGLHNRGGRDDQERVFGSGACDFSGADEPRSGEHQVEGTGHGGPEDDGPLPSIPPCHHDGQGTSVLSRVGGRRRVGQSKGGTPTKRCPDCACGELVGRTDSLDRESAQTSERRSVQKERGQEQEPTGLLGDNCPRTDSPSLVQSDLAVPRPQKTSGGDGHRVGRHPSESDQRRYTSESLSDLTKDGAVYELTRVLSVTRREVTGLPVFNLGTSTATYEANGFLVHNCGLPVVAWDYGAMRETVRDGDTGFLVTGEDDFLRAVRAVAADGVSDACRQRCREWAAQFTVGRMAERYERLCVEAIDCGW